MSNTSKSSITSPIAGNPEIKPENISCAGFLYKKPEKNSFLWKRRYAILQKNELAIYYYDNPEKARLNIKRGKIPFTSVHLWDGKPNGIQFYTPTEKCYRLYCDTPEERDMWITRMQEQIDTAPEKKEGEFFPPVRPTVNTFVEDKGEMVSRECSWRGEQMDIPWLLQEIQDLRSEVASLRGTVHAYKKVEKAGENNQSIARASMLRKSFLPDGTEVAMKPSELEIMRQIFNLFAHKDHTYILADDLQNLHRTLGEPITKEEADEALAFINPADGKVDFISFIKWWTEDHKINNEQPEKMKRYKAKFKFLKARIANPAIGRIESEAEGPFPSFEFRLKFYHRNDDDSRTQISPWHDIPLYNTDGTVNFICEIPKWTRKKMEIATGEPFNPIKQDTKNGKLREYEWGDMMFNYGALPQTWEDPDYVTEGTGCAGDNDPIDVVEIGTKQWSTGAVVSVKIIGVLALIDSGETDWKVICINAHDQYASMINDVADIEAHMPGCITAIHDWLRDYKLPKINQYGYEGRCMNRDFAEAVVQETHEAWKCLTVERGGMATV